jgi:hypothetical protein
MNCVSKFCRFVAIAAKTNPVDVMQCSTMMLTQTFEMYFANVFCSVFSDAQWFRLKLSIVQICFH